MEDSLKQLKRKLAGQEDKNFSLIAEVHRFEAVVKELHNDKERLNQRMHEMEDTHSLEMRDREQRHEQSLKQRLETEYHDLARSFGGEKGNLEVEVHRYRLKLEQSLEDLTILKTEIFRLQQTITIKGKEADEWKIKHDTMARENKDLKENLESELRKKLVLIFNC